MKHSVGRRRIYSSDAEKAAAYRARKNKRTLSVLVDDSVMNELDAFMRRRVDSDNPDETKAEVVQRALRAFLRRR